MDRNYLKQHRLDNLRMKRRALLILAGFAVLFTALFFNTDPDSTMTISIAVLFYFFTLMLVPDRWLARDPAASANPAASIHSPQPAPRTAPPPAPQRFTPRRWPPRTEPLPAPPPRPRER